MKLLLTSNGLVTPEIIAKFEELVGKPLSEVNVAVINEAYAVEHNDHRWLIDDLVRLKDHVGGRIEIVDLLANDKDTIRDRVSAADAIFVTGGSSGYLKTVYDKSGFSDLLPEFLKSKVYLGISAGSMVLGRRISPEALRIMYGDQEAYGVSDFLGVVNFSVMPHINSEDFPGRKEKLLKAIPQNLGLIYGLTDDSAIVVEDANIYFIGDAPLKAENGKVQ